MRIEMGDEKFPMAIRQEDEADAEGQHHQQRIAEQQLDPVERTGLEAETEVAPAGRADHFTVVFGVERHCDQSESEIEEQYQPGHTDNPADLRAAFAADAVSGEHTHRGHDHATDEEHERGEIEQQESREDIARTRIGFEGEGAEAHPVPALVPQAGHRPWQQQAQRQPAERGLPHVGQAEKEAVAVAATANAAPTRARKAVAQRAETSDTQQVEDRQRRDCRKRDAKRFVPARDQRLRDEAQPEVGNAEQDKNHDETNEQFHSGACPFEIFVDEARARPQVAALPCGCPETVDAQGDDGEQQIGQRDPREILPIALEREGAVGVFVLVRPVHE